MLYKVTLNLTPADAAQGAIDPLNFREYVSLPTFTGTSEVATPVVKWEFLLNGVAIVVPIGGDVVDEINDKLLEHGFTAVLDGDDKLALTPLPGRYNTAPSIIAIAPVNLKTLLGVVEFDITTGVLPSTLVISKAKTRANMRYRTLLAVLGSTSNANVEVLSVDSTGDTACTEIVLAISTDAGFYVVDKNGKAQYGPDGIKAAVELIGLQTIRNLVIFYDPTDTNNTGTGSARPQGDVNDWLTAAPLGEIDVDTDVLIELVKITI